MELDESRRRRRGEATRSGRHAGRGQSRKAEIGRDPRAAAAIALVVIALGHEVTAELGRRALVLDHAPDRYQTAILDADLRYERGDRIATRLEAIGIRVGWSAAFAEFRRAYEPDHLGAFHESQQRQLDQLVRLVAALARRAHAWKAARRASCRRHG